MIADITSSERLLAISLSAIAFCSFAWALRGHFMATGRIPTGMRLLSLASLFSYLTYIGLLSWRGYHASIATTLGLVGFALSLSLFWWTVAATRSNRLRLAYTDSDPDGIGTRGPYAVVRHPFYLSYICFWISTALTAGTWQWAMALVLTLWYVHIARNEEKRFQSSSLAAAYAAYRGRTGMLLPRISIETSIAHLRSAIRRTLFEVADLRGNRSRSAADASPRSDTGEPPAGQNPQ